MSDSTREFDPSDKTPCKAEKWIPVTVPMFILVLGAYVFNAIVRPFG